MAGINRKLALLALALAVTLFLSGCADNTFNTCCLREFVPTGICKVRDGASYIDYTITRCPYDITSVAGNNTCEINYVLNNGTTIVTNFTICARPSPDPCEKKNCTAMICGVGKYNPQPTMSAKDAQSADTGKTSYDSSFGKPSLEEETMLYQTTCSFLPLNTKVVQKIKRSRGRLWINTLRFGVGKTFSEFEEARNYFPMSDELCYGKKVGLLKERYMNYYNYTDAYCTPYAPAQPRSFCPMFGLYFSDTPSCEAYCGTGACTDLPSEDKFKCSTRFLTESACTSVCGQACKFFAMRYLCKDSATGTVFGRYNNITGCQYECRAPNVPAGYSCQPEYTSPAGPGYYICPAEFDNPACTGACSAADCTPLTRYYCYADGGLHPSRVACTQQCRLYDNTECTNTNPPFFTGPDGKYEYSVDSAWGARKCDRDGDNRCESTCTGYEGRPYNSGDPEFSGPYCNKISNSVEVNAAYYRNDLVRQYNRTYWSGFEDSEGNWVQGAPFECASGSQCYSGYCNKEGGHVRDTCVPRYDEGGYEIDCACHPTSSGGTKCDLPVPFSYLKLKEVCIWGSWCTGIWADKGVQRVDSVTFDRDGTEVVGYHPIYESSNNPNNYPTSEGYLLDPSSPYRWKLATDCGISSYVVDPNPNSGPAGYSEYDPTVFIYHGMKRCKHLICSFIMPCGFYPPCILILYVPYGMYYPSFDLASGQVLETDPRRVMFMRDTSYLANNAPHVHRFTLDPTTAFSDPAATCKSDDNQPMVATHGWCEPCTYSTLAYQKIENHPGGTYCPWYRQRRSNEDHLDYGWLDRTSSCPSASFFNERGMRCNSNSLPGLTGGQCRGYLTWPNMYPDYAYLNQKLDNYLKSGVMPVVDTRQLALYCPHWRINWASFTMETYYSPDCNNAVPGTELDEFVGWFDNKGAMINLLGDLGDTGKASTKLVMSSGVCPRCINAFSVSNIAGDPATRETRWGNIQSQLDLFFGRQDPPTLYSDPTFTEPAGELAEIIAVEYADPPSSQCGNYSAAVTDIADFARLMNRRYRKPILVFNFQVNRNCAIGDIRNQLGYLFNNTNELSNSGTIGVIYQNWAPIDGPNSVLEPSGAQGELFCSLQQNSQKMVGVTQASVYLKTHAEQQCMCEPCTDYEVVHGLCTRTCEAGGVCQIPHGGTIAASWRCPGQCIRAQTCRLCTDLPDTKLVSCIITTKFETIATPPQRIKDLNPRLDKDIIASLPPDEKCCFEEADPEGNPPPGGAPAPETKYTYIKKEGTRQDLEQLIYSRTGNPTQVCSDKPMPSSVPQNTLEDKLIECAVSG
jgi:hypothetical protein